MTTSRTCNENALEDSKWQSLSSFSKSILSIFVTDNNDLFMVSQHDHTIYKYAEKADQFVEWCKTPNTTHCPYYKDYNATSIACNHTLDIL